MAKVSEIYDDFEDGTLNTTLWNDSLNATEGSGYAAITAAGTYSNRLGSNTTRDFTQDTFQWEWTFAGASVTGSEQFFEIYTGAAGQTIQMGVFQGSLGYDYNGNAEYVTFNATNHRFCRIRTTATQIFFEASANGTTWTNPFTTGVRTLAAWSLTSVILKFVNAFFSGAGSGDMRIMSAGVQTTVAASGSDTSSGDGVNEQIAQSDLDTRSLTENQTIAASSSDTDTRSIVEDNTIGVTDLDLRSVTESESVSQPAGDSDPGNQVQENQSVSASASDTDARSISETESLTVTLSSSDLSQVTEMENNGDDTPSSSEGSIAYDDWFIQRLNAPATERALVQGPGTIWIAPYGAVEPANGSVGSDPDSGVWTDLGGLLGGVELSVDQEWIEVELKQLPDKPMKRLKRRRMSIKTQLAETTLANLAYALNETTAITGQVFEPSNRSEASILSYNALIVDGWAPSFKPGGRHKRRRLIIRKCLSVDNVQLAYKKDGQSVYTVTWTCHYVDSVTPPFRVIDEA
jgi:hypothetical protein